MDELLGIWRLGEGKKQEEKISIKQLRVKAREATNKDDSWNFKSDSIIDKEVTLILQTDIYFKILKSHQGKIWSLKKGIVF